MSQERAKRNTSTDPLAAVGMRSGCFAEGVRLLSERLDDHSAIVERIGQPSTSAQTALAKMAIRLSLPADEFEPSRFLATLHTYYALVVKLATCAILEQEGRGTHLASDRPLRELIEQTESGQRAAQCGATGFPDSPLLAWYGDCWDRPLWDRPLENWLGRLNETVVACETLPPEADPARGNDLFGTFYQSLFPKQVRHALGEHYTPGWLADHLLDQVGFDGTGTGRLLDPTCGSGVFLLRALHRLRRQTCPAVGQVVGFDVNPLAVLSAKANYLLAIRDRLDPRHPIEPPVHPRDVVLDEPSGDPYDFLVGNPPWLAWDHLPDDYRERTKSLWQHYGLFSLSGSEARHGGGKKDLAMLVLYAGAERYLRDGGRLGMVVTQTLFQTRGAGDGFRGFRLGEEGQPLAVMRVDDLVDVQPFETASNWTATVVMTKGSETVYPVPYVRWRRSGSPALPRLEMQPLVAEPIDRHHPRSPWFVRPADLGVGIEQLTGPSDYQAHLGANTGGANGVYWLQLHGKQDGEVEVENMPGRGKQDLPQVRTCLEPDLLYPLVRWGDLGRFHARPSAHLLLTQDPNTRRGIDEDKLREEFPKTHAYLSRFENHLRSRAAYRRYQDSAAFYSMYNVGPYTVAPHKVVWRRMDRMVRAAVLSPADDPLLGMRPVLCQETCCLIAVESSEEAHYLAALLNSAPVGFLVQAHNVRGGKGFGSPGMVEYLQLRRFDPENSDHVQLAALSGQAHQAASRGESLDAVQKQIDSVAARLYGLSLAEAESISRLVAYDG